MSSNILKKRKHIHFLDNSDCKHISANADINTYANTNTNANANKLNEKNKICTYSPNIICNNLECDISHTLSNYWKEWFMAFQVNKNTIIKHSHKFAEASIIDRFYCNEPCMHDECLYYLLDKIHLKNCTDKYCNSKKIFTILDANRKRVKRILYEDYCKENNINVNNNNCIKK